MEVTIGVQNVARELTIDTDQHQDEVVAAVEAALADGGALRLKDTKGRLVVVPGRSIGWIQIGDGDKGRVGFGLA